MWNPKNNKKKTKLDKQAKQNKNRFVDTDNKQMAAGGQRGQE